MRIDSSELEEIGLRTSASRRLRRLAFGLSFLPVLVSIGCSSAEPSVPPWKQVWTDNFNGPADVTNSTAAFTYSGSPQGLTATVSGVGSDQLTISSITYDGSAKADRSELGEVRPLRASEAEALHDAGIGRAGPTRTAGCRSPSPTVSARASRWTNCAPASRTR